MKLLILIHIPHGNAPGYWGLEISKCSSLLISLLIPQSSLILMLIHLFLPAYRRNEVGRDLWWLSSFFRETDCYIRSICLRGTSNQALKIPETGDCVVQPLWENLATSPFSNRNFLTAVYALHTSLFYYYCFFLNCVPLRKMSISSISSPLDRGMQISLFFCILFLRLKKLCSVSLCPMHHVLLPFL